MKTYTATGLLTFPLLALCALFCACGTVEKDLETLATNPNVVASVGSLIDQATIALQHAIDQAEGAALRVLATDANGVVVAKDTGAELRDIKAQLERVTLPVKLE